MHLKISHKSTYRYDAPISYGLQQLRLTPKSRGAQTVLNWHVEITGGTRQLSFEDAHMNTVDLVALEDGTQDVSIHCHGEVDLQETHGVIGPHAGFMPLWMFERETALTKPGPLSKLLVRGLRGQDDTAAQMHALSAAVLEAMPYQIGSTHAGISAEEALARGAGVCQDHAHVFVACARQLGVPARYVSGYLMMNDRVEQDATHAWVEAHVGALGWVGFDVSNGISPDTRYVRVATGLDYADASPISGTRVGAGDERLEVAVQVQQQ